MEIKAKLTIGPDGIDVDFAGSPGIVQLGINVPLCYTEAYTSFGVKCIVAPRVPNNAGLARHHPRDRARGLHHERQASRAVAARSIIVPDAARRGVRLPAAGTARRVPAEGTSCLWNVRLMGGMRVRVDGDPALLQKATPFNVTTLSIPAAPAPGPSSTACRRLHSPAACGNVPVEITETIAPVLVWSKEYRTDSGGAGEYRGGLGQIMEVESAEDMPFGISTSFDRVVYPPRGRAGGKAGMTGRVELASGKTLAPKAHSSIPVGERLRDQHARRRRLRRSAQASGGEGGGRRGARSGIGRKGARTLWRRADG